jgi:hypothetical protein
MGHKLTNSEDFDRVRVAAQLSHSSETGSESAILNLCNQDY